MSLKHFLMGVVTWAGVSFSGLGATFTVTNTLDSGAGSLRQAISDANNTLGANLITFNIPGTGVQTIRSSGGVLLVTSPVSIDGTTQPGYAGMPLIVLDGAGRPGFQITAGNSTIRALVVMDCGTASVPASGIVLSTNGGNVIAGCFIGCDATGTNSGFQKNNYLHGIQIANSPNNVIGGTNAADRNIIFGNGGSGVAISGAGATNNLVEGNYIGLNLAGTPGYPNGFTSFNVPNVLITNAPRNTIGGVVAGARNVIAGYADGIRLAGLGATGNQIQGNYIGTAPNGSAFPGGYNKYYYRGVWIVNAPSNTVGGAVSGAGNLISGTSYGITISGTNANANVIQGNFIGTDVSGTSTNDNYMGIYISQGAQGTLIGGTAPGAGNLISANDSEGIFISGSSDNVIQGNFIGTDVTGTAALGNTPPGDLGSGVLIDYYLFPATNNLIGGASAGARNIISGNNDTGIEFGYGPSNNVVQGNFIGTDVTGSQPLGNINDGILIWGAAGTLIGGTNAGEGNLISANGGAGVDIESGSSGTLIQGNTIGLTFNSVLSADKPAPSNKPKIPAHSLFNKGSPLVFDDAIGATVGSPWPPVGNNNFGVVSGGTACIGIVSSDQINVWGNNFYTPSLTSLPIVIVSPNNPPPTASITTAKSTPDTATVTGTATGTANSQITVQVYFKDPVDQVVVWTAETTITTDANGNGSFTVSVPGTGSPNDFDVAVTATDAPGGTSVFSSWYMVVMDLSGTMPPNPKTFGNFFLSSWVGDNVSTFTGELYESLPADLDLGGPLPLSFQRYYAAFIQTDGLIAGALGGNWLHNFEMTLTVTPSNTVNIVNNQGRLIPFTNNLGSFILLGRHDIPFQLAASGGNYILGDPRSQMLYTFNSSGRLITIADGHGNAQTLSYTGSQLASVTDGLGRTLTFQYSGSGFLTNVSDGTRSVGFVQTGNNLTSSADALGLVTTYSYDLTNSIPSLMTAMTLPAGNAPFTQTFDAQGRVVSQTAAGSNTTTLAYASLVTTITDPLGRTNVHTYTATGEFNALTDETGLTLRLGNDANRRRTSVTDRLGQTTFIGYHAPSGKPAAITNADGTVTTFTYASRAASGITFYDLAQVSYPDGTSESFTYDASGNVLTRTDRAGKVFTFTYNARGQPLTAQNPIGGVTTFAYNADGTLASRLDSDTGTAQFYYDGERRMTNLVHPDSTALHTQFDANDRMLSITDERGDTTTFNYDNDNRLIAAVDAAGKTNRFFFDGFNRVVRATDRLGNSTATSYDALQHVASMTNRNGYVTSFAYDTRQRLSAFTDPGGKAWSFGYDNEALLVAATNPLGQTEARGLNLLGYPVTFTNALGQVSSVARDSMERTTKAVDAISRTNGFGYEPRGLLAGTTAPLIGTANYQRNNLGLLSGITGLNGEQWNFTYTPMGRLHSLADPLNRTNAYSYDSRGRLQRVVFADGVVRSNSYDQASNPTRRQYSGGPDLQFTYDPLNRLASANDLSFAYDPEGRVTNTVSSGVNQGAAYDAGGRLVSVSYNNGTVTVTYLYDSRSRLTQVSDTLTGTQITFSYDDAGRLIGIIRPNGVNGTYTYNAAGRLTRIQEGAIIDIQYTVDAAGQVVAANFTAPLDPATLLAPAMPTFAYDTAHQIKNSGYAFDARGRQTASPDHSYQWDGASRLVGIDGVALAYNGANNIETRATGGVTTRFFYNHALALTPIMAERNEGTLQIQRYYVWTPGGKLLYLIDATSGNAVRFFHYDRVGSTLALTSGAGAVTDAYAYSPYGVLLGHTGTSPQPFTYIGEFGVRGEAAANLYHMRARYYDPISARFLTRDALWPRLADNRTLDPYNYANENPLLFIDPAGAEEQEIDIFAWLIPGWLFDIVNTSPVPGGNRTGFDPVPPTTTPRSAFEGGEPSGYMSPAEEEEFVKSLHQNDDIINADINRRYDDYLKRVTDRKYDHFMSDDIYRPYDGSPREKKYGLGGYYGDFLGNPGVSIPKPQAPKVKYLTWMVDKTPPRYTTWMVDKSPPPCSDVDDYFFGRCLRTLGSSDPDDFGDVVFEWSYYIDTGSFWEDDFDWSYYWTTGSFWDDE